MKSALLIASLALGCSSAPRDVGSLLDSPVWQVERAFGSGATQHCYHAGPDRYVVLTVDTEDTRRFSGAIISEVNLCETSQLPQTHLPSRFNLPFDLGADKLEVTRAMGTPAAIERSEGSGNSRLTRLGDELWRFECTTPKCWSATLVFFRAGRVSAIEMLYYA